MRKLLLTTTALLGATALSSAAFAEGHEGVQISAFNNFDFGVSSNDDDAASDGGYAGTDTEISFKWSTTSDSGMTYGLDIELQADEGDAGPDENSVFFMGSWGKVTLGNNDGAADIYGVQATYIGAERGQTGEGELSGISGWAGSLTSVEISNDGGDATKATYQTPNFGGFEAGVSWTPSTRLFGAGAMYAGDFGGVGVDVGASYATGEGDADVQAQSDVSAYMFGATVSVAGFAFGAGYANEVYEDDATAGQEDTTEEVWNVGAAYSFGPGAVNILYTESQTSNDLQERQELSVGGHYLVMPGVKLSAAYATGEVEGTTTDQDYDQVLFSVRTSW